MGFQAVLICSPMRAQISTLKDVQFQEGPSVGALENTASLKVPAGYVFAGAKDTRIVMEALQNPPSGNEMGFITPKDEDWFVIFQFDDVGYVKDEEKGSLNAKAMLDSIKAGTEQSNKERIKRGWRLMTVTGWEQQPRYDETTHNLEWAIRGESEGEPNINYNIRMLGRGGFMKVTLVTAPENINTTLPKFRALMGGYEFNQGHRYAEFTAGDKISKYGLTALVVGGAAAVAVKSGAFKWGSKLLVVGIFALLAWAKSLFSGK